VTDEVSNTLDALESMGRMDVVIIDPGFQKPLYYYEVMKSIPLLGDSHDDRRSLIVPERESAGRTCLRLWN
jgi:hypothetical protein